METTSKNFLNQFAVSKSKVICINSDATLLEAARIMRNKHVGNVLVVDQKAKSKAPVGILTDRDITIETLAQGVDPEDLRVSDIMSRNLAKASKSDDIFTMISKMKKAGVNRLPIVDERGNLEGVVTSRKLVQCLVNALEELGELSGVQKRKEKQVRH